MTGEDGLNQNLLEYKKLLRLPYLRSPKVLGEKDLAIIAEAMRCVSLVHKLTIEEDCSRATIKKIVASALDREDFGDEEKTKIKIESLHNKINKIENEQRKEISRAKLGSEEDDIHFKYRNKLRSLYEKANAINTLDYWESALVASKRATRIACERHPDIESASGQEFLKSRQRLEEAKI